MVTTRGVGGTGGAERYQEEDASSAAQAAGATEKAAEAETARSRRADSRRTGRLLVQPQVDNAIGGDPKERERRLERSKARRTKAPKRVKGGKSFKPSTVAKGSSGGVTKAGELVIRDEVAFTKVWAEVNSRRFPPPAPPTTIDFKKDMVLAVFLGARSSGGYSIEVASARQRKDGALEVSVRRTAPEPGRVTTQALTQPYHLVTVPRLPKDAAVVFVDTAAASSRKE